MTVHHLLVTPPPVRAVTFQPSDRVPEKTRRRIVCSGDAIKYIDGALNEDGTTQQTSRGQQRLRDRCPTRPTDLGKRAPCDECHRGVVAAHVRKTFLDLLAAEERRHLWRLRAERVASCFVMPVQPQECVDQSLDRLFA